MFWPMAFSVADWHCVDEDCPNTVSWTDGVRVFEDGRFMGLRHAECNE